MKAPDHRIAELRRQLAKAITDALGPHAQFGVSARYGISQPRMSELSRGIVHHCSMEWLIRRIHVMGGRVDLDLTVIPPRFNYAQPRRRLAPGAPYSVYAAGSTTSAKVKPS